MRPQHAFVVVHVQHHVYRGGDYCNVSLTFQYNSDLDCKLLGAHV